MVDNGSVDGDGSGCTSSRASPCRDRFSPPSSAPALFRSTPLALLKPWSIVSEPEPVSGTTTLWTECKLELDPVRETPNLGPAGSSSRSLFASLPCRCWPASWLAVPVSRVLPCSELVDAEQPPSLFASSPFGDSAAPLSRSCSIFLFTKRRKVVIFTIRTSGLYHWSLWNQSKQCKHSSDFYLWFY
jgi:hypothetical protein